MHRYHQLNILKKKKFQKTFKSLRAKWSHCNCIQICLLCLAVSQCSTWLPVPVAGCSAVWWLGWGLWGPFQPKHSVILMLGVFWGFCSSSTNLSEDGDPHCAAFLSFLLLLLWQLSGRSWLWFVLFLWSQFSCLNGSFSSFSHSGKSCWPPAVGLSGLRSAARAAQAMAELEAYMQENESTFTFPYSLLHLKVIITVEKGTLHPSGIFPQPSSRALTWADLSECPSGDFSWKSLEHLLQLCRKEIWRQPKCTQRFTGTCWKYGPCSHNPVCQTGWITAPNALSLLCSKWLYSGSHWCCWLKFL